MRALGRQIALLAAALLLICLVNRLAAHNAYTAYVPEEVDAWLAPHEMSVGEVRYARDHARVSLQPRGTGEAEVKIYSDGQRVDRRRLHIGPLGTVYDASTGGFTGDTSALVATTLFFLAVSALMMRWYLRVRVPEFYAYTSIYAAGFSLFALLTGGTLGYATIRHLLHPAAFSMRSAYRLISRAGYHFMLCTAPLLVAFALSMTVSNLALMRHEGYHRRNALGMLAGFLLLAGEAAAIWLEAHITPGPNQRILEVGLLVFPTIFVYFECMLIGAILCGLRAAGDVPSCDRDCLIILGCRFRRDGTLTPLLRSRVDRALEFWRDQQVRTGKRAVFIPSGGQGADEVMPEARAMADYLMARGVAAEDIHLEDQSRNTYENMAFTRALIEEQGLGPNVAYVTTNYHVFRSGVWANLAGLPCQGLGSDTKWWYWPNAFMREWAGLLINRSRQELALLMVLIAFFGVLSALL